MGKICGVYSEKKTSSENDISKMISPLIASQSDFRIFSDGGLLIGIEGGGEENIFGDSIVGIHGNIYNREELSKEILGEECSAEEFIARSYGKKGENLFQEIEGDYAVVIWKPEEEKLIFSNSLANHKNIFYSSQEEKLAFASDTKSLLELEEVEREVDRKSVSNFVKFGHIPSPHTPFEQVKRLEESTAAEFRKGKLQNKTQLFEPPSEPTITDLDEACEMLEKSIISALQDRVEEGEETHLMLSGGIDSSMLAYYLNQITEEKINTYTVSLEDDLEHARVVSDFFGTDHSEKQISDEKMLQSVPKVLWHQEYPSKDPGVSPLYHMREMEEGQNFIWGQGSEEITQGRLEYPALRLFKSIPASKKAASAAKLLTGNLKNKSRFRRMINLTAADDMAEEFVTIRDNLTETEKHFSKDILEEGTKRIRTPEMEGAPGLAWTTLVNGFLSDRFPVPRINLTSPFLDERVISTGYSITPKLHTRDRKPRYLIRKLMQDRLPDEITNRGRDSWAEQAGSIAEENKEVLYPLINDLRDRDILTSSAEEIAREGYKTNRKIWQLANLEIFLKIYVDRKYSSEPPELEEFL